MKLHWTEFDKKGYELAVDACPEFACMKDYMHDFEGVILKFFIVDNEPHFLIVDVKGEIHDVAATNCTVIE